MSLIYERADDGNYYAEVYENQVEVCDFSDNKKHFKQEQVKVNLRVKKIIRQSDGECVESTIVNISCPHLEFTNLKQFPCTHCNNYIPEFRGFTRSCKYNNEIRRIREENA